MTLPDLATLRRLHEEGTKGPWQVGGYEFDDAGMIRAGGGQHGGHPVAHTATSWQWEHARNEVVPNAELIAASRNALPALLHAADQWAEVQGMRERIVEQALDHSSRCAADSDSPAVEFDTCERCLFFRDLLALIDAPPKESSKASS